MWPFKRIVFTNYLDQKLFNGNLDFSEYMANISKELNAKKFDSIFVMRNYQPINEAILLLYGESIKICYGDAYGFIDLINASDLKLHNNANNIDKIICVAPCEITKNIFDEHFPEIVPVKYLVQAIQQASKHLTGLIDYCNNLNMTYKAETHLVCLENFTECGYIKNVTDEILYYNEALQPHLTYGSVIYIKGHVRESQNQSILLAKYLNDSGFNALTLNDYKYVPCECFAEHLLVSKLHSLTSSAAVSWCLMNPQTPVHIGVSSELREKYLSKTGVKNSGSQVIYYQACMARSGTFKILRSTEIPSQHWLEFCQSYKNIYFHNQSVISKQIEQLNVENLYAVDMKPLEKHLSDVALDGDILANKTLLNEDVTHMAHRQVEMASLTRYRPICKIFPLGIVILSDGSVTTCCYDSLGENVFGSIYDSNFISIWKRVVPKVLENGLYALKKCKNCVGATVVPLNATQGEMKDWLSWPTRYPIDVTIEIMGTCNYGCCVSKDMHKIRNVKPDLVAIFTKISPFLSMIKRLRLFNYGEPLLHDGFKDFVTNCRNASENLVFLIATNGLLLDESYAMNFINNRIDTIVISVHGGPGTENMLKYSKYGADYSQVLTNVKRLLDIRDKCNSEFPKVSLRAILFNWNDSDAVMNQFREDAKALGLSATGGKPNTDNYHWILDGGCGANSLPSKRFIPESSDLQQLINSKELMS
jgi:MoaA/NifB/PqqE/SkfB family radical SAM enzyme